MNDRMAMIERQRRDRTVGLSGTVPMGVREDALNQAGPAVQPVDLPIRLFPPVNWENVDQLAYITIPAVGVQSVILRIQVPIGRNGIIRKIANNYVGAGWVEGSGDVIWRILIDGGAPPPGANSYNSIAASLGSPANPVEVPGFRVFENQVLTFEVLNVAIVPAGQKIGARLVGYFYPRELEDADIWI